MHYPVIWYGINYAGSGRKVHFETFKTKDSRAGTANSLFRELFFMIIAFSAMGGIFSLLLAFLKCT